MFIKTSGSNLLNLAEVVEIELDDDSCGGVAFLRNEKQVSLHGIDVAFATSRIVPAQPGFELLMPIFHENGHRRRITGISRRPVIAWQLHYDDYPKPIAAGWAPFWPLHENIGLKYPNGRVETSDGTCANETYWLKEQRQLLAKTKQAAITATTSE